jgi:hypothetical protein
MANTNVRNGSQTPPGGDVGYNRDAVRNRMDQASTDMDSDRSGNEESEKKDSEANQPGGVKSTDPVEGAPDEYGSRQENQGGGSETKNRG